MDASDKIIAKAHSYLISGSVKVKDAMGKSATIHVTPPDGGDPYIVKKNGVGWACDCPARVAVCAHVYASHLIIPEDREAPSVSFSSSTLDEFLNGL